MTLSLVLFASILGMISISCETADASAHAPIRILQDSDFNATNGVVSGNGTAANPYVISGWEVRDNGTCIEVMDVTKVFTITNVTIYSPASGVQDAIYLHDVTNGECVLDNITIFGPDRYLIVSGCSRMTFRNITMGNEGRLAISDSNDLLFIDIDLTRTTGRIQASDSHDCRFVRCRTAGIRSGTGALEGIMFTDCDNMNMSQCNSSSHWIGLSIVRGNGCNVVDCDFWDNVEYDVGLATIGTNSHRLNSTRMGPRGLLAGGPDVHDIDRSNRVSGKVLHYHVDETGGVIDGDAGQVYLFGCHDFKVANLSMEGPYSAITAYDCRNLTMSNITASGYKYSLNLALVPDPTISDCSFTGLPSSPYGAFGIYAEGCANLTVIDTVFSEVQLGVWAWYTSGIPSRTVIRGCDFLDAATGVTLKKGNESLIESCYFEDCDQGVVVSESVSTRIANSTLYASGGYGISASTTGPMEIERNVIRGAKYGAQVSGSDIDIVGNDVSDCSDTGLISTGAPMLVANNTCTNCTIGMIVENDDMLMANNTVRGSSIGVAVGGKAAKNGTMRDCSVLGSSTCGILMKVSGCSFINCTVDDAPTGIVVNQTLGFATIIGCVVSNCTVGIDLVAGGAVVNASLVRDCTSYGVRGAGGRGRVYWTTFLRTNYDPTEAAYNGPQAFSDGLTWFYSEGNEGNYWDDYQLRYPDAKVVNFKFWDTPYKLAGTNFDMYPLATPVDLVPPVADAGGDVTVPQGTTVVLDGSGSTDNLGIARYVWGVLYGPAEQKFESMRTNFTFDLAGAFKATLTVWDRWGNSASDATHITVLDTERPVVDAGGDMTVDQREAFSLDASGSSDNVAIARYRWTVDPDGLNLTFDASRATLSIERVGRYLAVLNVSDLAGNWATGTLNITVVDIDRPVADAGEDLVVDQGALVTFDGTNSTDNARIANMSWSFKYGGEAVALEGDRPSFRFDVPGTYTVTLAVTDAAGLMGVDEMTVEVRDTEPPVARAGGDVTVEPGTLVALDGSASTDNVGIVAWRWSLTYDGIPIESSATYFQFLFDIEGEYAVGLELEDAAGNLGSVEVRVLVRDSIPPVAEAGEDVTLDQHRQVTFDGSGSSDEVGIAGWLWTFDYGGARQVLEGASPSFTFEEVGVYLVTLTVTDGAGNSATDTVQVEVLDTTPPRADAGPDRTVDQSVPCELDGGLSTDNVAITGYLWVFTYGGNQTSLQGRVVGFTFDRPGSYTITLKVEDPQGLSSTDTMVLTVRDTERPVAKLAMDPDAPQARGGETYAFDGSGSTDNVAVVNWTWTLLREGEVTGRLFGERVAFTFTRDGRYTINLTVQDAAGNVASDTRTIDVRKVEGDGGGTSLLALGLVLVCAIAVACALAIVSRRKRACGP